MKLWVDDVRPAPEGYVWAKSVDEAKMIIWNLEDIIRYRYSLTDIYAAFKKELENCDCSPYIKKLAEYCVDSDYELTKPLKPSVGITLVDLDHDAGEYFENGGDYIRLLDWFEETGRNYPIHLHSMNPVGVENMRRIIKRNGWKEV